MVWNLCIKTSSKHSAMNMLRTKIGEKLMGMCFKKLIEVAEATEFVRVLPTLYLVLGGRNPEYKTEASFVNTVLLYK